MIMLTSQFIILKTNNLSGLSHLCTWSKWDKFMTEENKWKRNDFLKRRGNEELNITILQTLMVCIDFHWLITSQKRDIMGHEVILPNKLSLNLTKPLNPNNQFSENTIKQSSTENTMGVLSAKSRLWPLKRPKENDQPAAMSIIST
jgi:hypothetical protein